jgi:hypothetical protein
MCLCQGQYLLYEAQQQFPRFLKGNEMGGTLEPNALFLGGADLL